MTAPADMTDRDLDAVMATKVMRWERGTTADMRYRGRYAPREVWRKPGGEHAAFVEDWRPTSDPRDSRRVVERMAELGYRVEIRMYEDGVAHVTVGRPGTADEWRAGGKGVGLDRAICEAAAKFLRGILRGDVPTDEALREVIDALEVPK